MPRATKAPTAAATTAAKAGGGEASDEAVLPKRPYPKPTKSKKPTPGSADDPLLFLLGVQLDGEDSPAELIPIYDSCDEVRRKIRAFFRDPKFAGITQKRFREECANVAPGSYQNFMKKKGPGAGAENKLYPNAYVFFEKKRIYEGKAKTKTRLESEELYPDGRELIDENRPVFVTMEEARRAGARLVHRQS